MTDQSQTTDKLLPDVVEGTREAIIQAVENEMGYYDIPEAEPEITFTGKTVCDLVDLAKELLEENSMLDDVASERQIEICNLKRATPVPEDAKAALDALEDVENALNEYKDLERHLTSFSDGHRHLSGLSQDN